MALIHWAELTPSKLELLRLWVPSQAWLGEADPDGLAQLGAYRFDDPAGVVGIETHLLATGSGAVLQVPLTYRPEPLEGVVAVATLQHSVLGRRWVYDGLTDPVYLQALVTTVLTGAEQAALFRATDGEPQPLPPSALAWGSGSATTPVPEVQPGPTLVSGTTSVVEAGPVTVILRHRLDVVELPAEPGTPTLSGRWPGQDEPVVLASVRLRHDLVPA